MKTIISALTLLLLATTASATVPVKTISYQPNKECFEHCVEISRIGASVSVLWKGAEGVPVKVITADVPADAVLVEGLSETPGSYSSGYNTTQSSGVTSSVSHQTYVTETEIVVVITTLVFDSNGNLLSVNVHTTRTAIPRDDDSKMEQ